MNTSFPSAASDFGAFLAGGNQPNANANLKGIFASLGCAKNAAPDSAPTAKSNFDAILDDAPAVGSGTASVAKQTAVAGGISDGESGSPISDNSQSGFAGRFGARVTTTLQIKGMVAGGCTGQSALQTAVSAGAPDGKTSVVQDGIKSDQNAASADSTAQPLNPDVSEIAEAGQSGSGSSKETGTGPTLPRQIKMLPGRGQSSRGHGWNPALIVHTGTRAKSLTPNPTDSTAVQQLSPEISDAAPAIDSVSVQTADITGSAIVPVVPLEQFQAIALKTADDAVQTDCANSAESETGTPAALSIGESVGELSPVIAEASALADQTKTPDATDIAAGSIPAVPTAPTEPVTSTASSPNSTAMLPTAATNAVALPSTTISTQVLSAPALPVEAMQGSAASTDIFAPIVENLATATEVSPELPAQVEKAPTAPELRREVVETVAAMISPFLMNLPALQPELMSNASAALSGDAAAAGQGNTINSTITVKIGAQPPFQFELSPSDFPQTATNDLTGNSSTVDDSADGAASSPSAPTTSSDHASRLLPMAGPLLTDATPPLDFRIQVKAKIDAAWQQSEQTGGSVATSASPNSAVVDGNPAIPAGIPPAIGQEAASKSEEPPIDVTIKLPGLGTVTAQIVASDAATIIAEKKFASRSSRTEKTAGDFRSDVINRNQENMRPEKTFLNAGEQVVKGKDENAGTTVAISDDTMPARFTSHRVTVDQLEMPARFDGREIRPVLNEPQDLAVANDAPVSSTPAPVLAHRAVETILNVVDAQRQSSANASSVNLHFKFGGDDLAVRVQMRGGEVLTQFITDSAELRSALSSEWQIVAGQGNASALRMHEPVILPASTGTSSGFGSASQGQNHSQQNSPQQQAHSPEVMHELRELRRGSPSAAPAATPVPAPATPVSQPSSRLLAATA